MNLNDKLMWLRERGVRLESLSPGVYRYYTLHPINGSVQWVGTDMPSVEAAIGDAVKKMFPNDVPMFVADALLSQ